jgi:hypothetical protein
MIVVFEELSNLTAIVISLKILFLISKEAVLFEASMPIDALAKVRLEMLPVELVLAVTSVPLPPPDKMVLAVSRPCTVIPFRARASV